ncbi:MULTISPECIES: cytochrome P450 [unclassified Streptomyces]|uniref:cytochrome P450 family protein n=1 Tax=unclassified Streptomyces TaxID=2593676 RepID=UPI002481B41F|nr:MULTISPECIES: cytochrome P450 [unclassified Streptomyces]MDA5280835.1 cytochrome P450 [Streptomyces sp. Isolate_45]MDX2393786.1 cytochrome P450 [Streptomyces sp. DK15]
MTGTRALSKYWMLTNDFTQNPYPVLEYVRRESPVRELSFPDGGRAWVVTRYEDAKAALADPRLSRDVHVHYRLMSERTGRTMTPPPEEANHLANLEPPRHTPLRRAISFAFTPRRAEALRPKVEQIADELLDRLAGLPRPDLISGYADPLPVIVIAELMGVPADAWPDFLRWSTALRTHSPTEGSGALDRNIQELSRYMSALIAEKEREPGEDLLSALIHADPERRLTSTEILSTGFALMTGGNDTTASLVGGVIAALLAHPAERAELLAEPGRWGRSMDELIRYVSPIGNALQRVTTEPVELGGVTIPAGEVVVVSVMSTNRDPHQFPDDPDGLDLTRPKPAHLSFGFGIHYCSGAHLAKVITEIAARRLFERFPRVRFAVDPSELRYQQNVVVRPLEALPVVF